MSKFLSMDALSSVSSWCVPCSISRLAAASGLCCCDEGSLGSAPGAPRFLEGPKPRFCAGSLVRAFSTAPRARSARTLTALMMSSRRDFFFFVFVSCAGPGNGIPPFVLARETYHWRVVKVLGEQLVLCVVGRRHGDVVCWRCCRGKTVLVEAWSGRALLWETRWW